VALVLISDGLAHENLNAYVSSARIAESECFAR
jgi:hypothetical protein